MSSRILRDLYHHRWNCLNNAAILQQYFLHSTAAFYSPSWQSNIASTFQLCRILTTLQPCAFVETPMASTQNNERGSMLMRYFSAQ